MAFWNRKKPDVPAAGEGLDRTQLPQHVGIIMDGNGRWAKKRGLPRTAGHAAGAETFRTIAYYCRDIGIPYLTVYAFSTENWKRPVEEVATIMDLLHKYLLEVLEKMERDGFRVHFFGNLEPLPPALRDLCLRAEETAASLSGKRHQVNIASTTAAGTRFSGQPKPGGGTCWPAGRRWRTSPMRPSPATWTAGGCRILISSFAPAGNCGCPTS